MTLKGKNMIDLSRIRFVIETLSKAGWISEGKVFEAPQKARLQITPSEAGRQRFHALLILVSELEKSAQGRIFDDEMGFVCNLAKTYALSPTLPAETCPIWPKELASAKAGPDRRF
jgi:hypothetical protein